jgi:hypothetical protein
MLFIRLDWYQERINIDFHIDLADGLSAGFILSTRTARINLFGYREESF